VLLRDGRFRRTASGRARARSRPDPARTLPVRGGVGGHPPRAASGAPGGPAAGDQWSGPGPGGRGTL